MQKKYKIDCTPEDRITKIKGTVSHYKKQRKLANFFFTDQDKNIMSLAAIAGALAGAAGQAVSTARVAANLNEEADYVEMKVNGQIAKGWVWFSPFKKGDEVELIGIQKEGYFEIVAIVRPKDRVISLYPHCSRGKNAHIKAIIKWWFISITSLTIFFVPLLFSIFELIKGNPPLSFLSLPYFAAALFMYIIGAVYSAVTGRKFMMYVNAATQIFKTIGLENPDDVDLPKKTKRKPGDIAAFGIMYFNY